MFFFFKNYFTQIILVPPAFGACYLFWQGELTSYFVYVPLIDNVSSYGLSDCCFSFCLSLEYTMLCNGLIEHCAIPRMLRCKWICPYLLHALIFLMREEGREPPTRFCMLSINYVNILFLLCRKKEAAKKPMQTRLSKLLKNQGYVLTIIHIREVTFCDVIINTSILFYIASHNRNFFDNIFSHSIRY